MTNQPQPDEQPRIGDDGELKGEKFCVQCGSVNALKANYCSNCGARFEGNVISSIPHIINELPHIDIANEPSPAADSGASMRDISRYMEEVDARRREAEQKWWRLLTSPFAVGTLFSPIAKAILLTLLVVTILCYVLSQLTVSRFNPIVTPSLDWSASPAPSVTTGFAFEETLPGKADAPPDIT